MLVLLTIVMIMGAAFVFLTGCSSAVDRLVDRTLDMRAANPGGCIDHWENGVKRTECFK